MLAAVAVGLAFRLLQYAANRSLWLDEVLLLPHFQGRSYRQILSPAGIGPIAPGFLALEKLATGALGGGDAALRLVPFVAGIASLFVFVAVARRALSAGAVLPATAAFAISPYLIYYTSELKPYATDVLAALLLTWLALVLRERGMTGRRAAGLAVAGFAAVLFSMPAAFVLVGVAVSLLIGFGAAGDQRSLRLVIAACAAWALVFVPALAVLMMRGALASGGSYTQAFWADGFLPFPPRTPAEVEWLPQAIATFFRDPLGSMNNDQITRGFFQPAGAMLLFAAGALSLRGARRFSLALLALPFAAALLGSALHVYPFGGGWVTGGRVLLYLVPAAMLLIGEGFHQLRTDLPRAMRPLAWMALAVAWFPSAAQLLVVFPSGRAEIKPLLAFYAQARQPGDLLYVHYDARPQFVHYAPRYGISPAEVQMGPCSRLEPAGYLDALSKLRGRERVWVLFMSGHGAHDYDEGALMLQYLRHVGRQVDARFSTGGSLFLFDLRPRPATAAFQVQTPVYPPSIEHGCSLWL
jgi:hypothetical protein